MSLVTTSLADYFNTLRGSGARGADILREARAPTPIGGVSSPSCVLTWQSIGQAESMGDY